MKFRCDRNELAECLGDVLGIIPATQAAKPIFLDFHLIAGPSGLQIEATDLDMAARMHLERVEVLEPGGLALPAVRLHSLVREIPDRSVMVEGFPDGRGAALRAGGFEFKLLGDDPREFPELPSPATQGVVRASREKFLEMLRRVAVASSRDSSRFQLTGVFFEVDGDTLTLTATDGKRLTNDSMSVTNPSRVTASAIVPNRVVDVLLKALSSGTEEFEFVLGDPNFQASFGRGALIGKVIQGSYPDYHPAIDDQVQARVIAKRNDLLAATKTAALMTDKNTATVLFRFEETRVCLSTKATEIGESKIEVAIQLEGAPFEVRYNPTFFLDALRSLPDDEVKIEFSHPDRPGAVRDSMNYRHLVMPLVLAK